MKTIVRFILWLTVLVGISVGAWALFVKLLHKSWDDLPWWLLAVQLVAIIIFAAGLSRKKDEHWAEPWWGYRYVKRRYERTISCAGLVDHFHQDKYFQGKRI